MASPPPPRTPHRPSHAPTSTDGAAGAGSGGLAAARERAIRILTDRYGDGMVDDVEFEERLARLRAASDTVMMDAVVADLPDAPQERATVAYDIAPRVTPPPPSPPPHGTLPSGERRLLAVFNEMRRSGWWEVPSFLRVRAICADLKLDLRDAPLPEGCTFEVAAYLAGVTIIVPPGTSVGFDVLPMLATAVSRAPGGGPVPQLRVTGTAFMAEVKVIVRERGEGRKRRATSWWGGSP